MAATVYWPNKSPAEVVDVGIDWSPFLSKLAEVVGPQTVTVSTWTREAGTATASSPSIDTDGSGTNVRLSGGGLVGESNRFRNDVTLSNGAVYQAWAVFKIRAA